MKLFVDFNGFYLNREFILKEFAYTSMHTSECNLIQFKPPKSIIDINFYNVIKYYENNLGITWNSGDVEFESILFIIKDILNLNEIYLFNSEKQSILKNNFKLESQVFDIKSFDSEKILLVDFKTSKRPLQKVLLAKAMICSIF